MVPQQRRALVARTSAAQAEAEERIVALETACSDAVSAFIADARRRGDQYPPLRCGHPAARSLIEVI